MTRVLTVDEKSLCGQDIVSRGREQEYSLNEIGELEVKIVTIHPGELFRYERPDHVEPVSTAYLQERIEIENRHKLQDHSAPVVKDEAAKARIDKCGIFDYDTEGDHFFDEDKEPFDD